MSTKKQILKGPAETWEDGHLGRDLNHAVRVGKEEEHKIEDAHWSKNHLNSTS